MYTKISTVRGTIAVIINTGTIAGIIAVATCTSGVHGTTGNAFMLNQTAAEIVNKAIQTGATSISAIIVAIIWF